MNVVMLLDLLYIATVLLQSACFLPARCVCLCVWLCMFACMGMLQIKKVEKMKSPGMALFAAGSVDILCWCQMKTPPNSPSSLFGLAAPSDATNRKKKGREGEMMRENVA